MMLLLSLLVASQLHLEGTVTRDGGDYHLLQFTVPADTAEVEITQSDNSDDDILDWGVWSPEGFRGWSGGLTEPIVIGEFESTRGYLPGPMTAGAWTLVIGKAKLVGGDASYTADITFRSTPSLAPRGRATTTPVVLSTERRWYSGDFHVHSRESGDASASFSEIAALARQRGLDFVVLSDHNTVSQQGLVAAYQPEVTDVLFVRGNEVTTYAGHGNALGTRAYVDHRIGLGGRTAADLIQGVVDQDGLFIINHPTLELGDACIGCAWQHEDTPWNLVGAMEILTGPFGPAALFTPQALELWDTRLDEGHRITAVGGSDDHRAGIGLNQFQSPIGSPTTMVFTHALSEDAIIDGVRRGRVVVKLRGPDDPFLEIHAITHDGIRGMIGDTVKTHQVTVEAHAVGAQGMALQVYKDGRPEDTASVDSGDWTQTFAYAVEESGHRFRVHLVESDRDVVVTNHIYVQHLAPPSTDDTGGCPGCPNGGAGTVISMAVLGLMLRRRR